MLIDGIGYFLVLMCLLGAITYAIFKWQASEWQDLLNWETLTAHKFGYILGIIAAVIVLVGFFMRHNSALVDEFYANIAAETASIAITVLIIDELNQRRQREEYRRENLKQEKEKLILQLGNVDIGFANDAARRLHKHGWLADGSLRGEYFHRTNLSSAFLENADFQECELSQSRFKFCMLNGANFKGANLTGANLSESHLISAVFDEATLVNADLNKATLAGASFQRAWLRSADLRAAFLLGADFTGADLAEIELDEAQYDENTIWPDGFDPESKGALFISQ